MSRKYLGLFTALIMAVLGATEARAKAPDANARQPQAAKDLDAIFDQTAAVVEGEVADITYSYDEKTGPWTQITLEGVKAHLGQMPQERLTLKVRGGHLPNGKIILVPELPSFALGKRYVVFLRNTSWSWAPVLGDLSLRYETVAGKEVLVDANGRPVVGVDAGGLRFGDKALFTPSMEARVQHQAPAEKAGNKPEDVRAAVSGRELAQKLKSELASRRRNLDATFFDEPASATWPMTATAARGAQPRNLPLVPSKAAPEPDTAPARQ